MRPPIHILFLLWCGAACAQTDFILERTSGLNTRADEIACCIMNGQLVYTSNDQQDLVSDYRWTENARFAMRLADRGKTFTEFTRHEKFTAKAANGDEGSACYAATDSMFYFSSAADHSGNVNGRLRIYTRKWNGREWEKAEVLPFCKGPADYAHPWFDEARGLLVFSSNRAGGHGGMDIWCVYRNGNGWGELICLDILVNSPGNEIFPTVWNGNIYYASDRLPGFGGFDIHCALQKHQWKVSVQMPAPINSPMDDLNFFLISEETGFLTSNRADGVGGDDIYRVKTVFETEKRGYTASVVVSGDTLKNSTVSVFNQGGELVLESNSGASGVFSLAKLDLNRPYKMTATGVSPLMYANAWLNIFNEEGVRIMQIPMKPDGSFAFELLPFDRGGSMAQRSTVDRSILSLSFEGQVIGTQPGPTESTMISIVDDDGELVAVAYTDQLGMFSVNNVTPDIAYTFRLSEESQASQVVIFDQGKKLTLPVLREEAHYARLNAGDAITLINENNQTVHLSSEDVFVINRIYYEYNSAHLGDNSIEQLDKLIRILENNPQLQIEIRSHTDSQGSDAYNLELSRRRAQVVKDYLVIQRIPATRISAVGLGETELLNKCIYPDNCSEAERAINRRTEIRIMPAGS